MKKKFKYLLFIVVCNLFVMNVYAASASITATASASKIQVGDTVTVSVSVSSKYKKNEYGLGAWDFSVGYDSSVLTYVSSTMERGLTSSSYVSSEGQTDKNYTLKFKAKAAGTATVSIKNAMVYELYSDSQMKTSISNATITVVSNSSKTSNSNSSSNKNNSNSNDNKSANNYLSSLSIDGYSISPKFSKSTSKYTLSVPNNVRKIKINAKTDNSKASVSGTGYVNLKEGSNKIDVVVTAENGNKKTYRITVTVLDKEPIVVKINKEEYTVLQDYSDIKIPDSYSKTTIILNNEKVVAYKSGLTGYTLIGLTDKKGKSNLYIYSDNTYTLYNEYKFSGISLYIKEPSVMLKDLKEIELSLDDEVIKAYKLDGNSYPLIYGMNIETGEENWYTYDESEKTLQKFVAGNKKGTKVSPIAQDITSTDKYKALSLMMCGISGILTMFLILSAIKISKQNKPEI